MDPKSKSRRQLLKGGAAAIGTVAAGASASKIASAATPASGPAPALPSYAANEAPMVPASEDVIAYGVRSHYVTSKRIPALGRPSPDDFGLEFHLSTPLQDSVGTIQASSLHYVATTKGSFIPDIDPAKHTLMIDGLVDRPRIFTMADLKRFPSVSRFHFIECSGNSANERDKSVQESHGLTSNAEWTGVLLSTLLKECGVQPKGTWFVAEAAEEIKGASTIPINKGMSDVIVAYGMNGEPLRPQQGFPVRLIVPGFEGIFNAKWLRHIKVVDQYQLNMNDFGHLRRDAKQAALAYQIGPKSVITYPSGGQKLPERGWYEITGLAWSGGGAIRTVEISTDGGKKWNLAELKTTPQRMAHVRFGYPWTWDGNATEILSRATDEIGQVQALREQIAQWWNVPAERNYRVPGLDNSIMPWKIAKDGSVTNGLA